MIARRQWKQAASAAIVLTATLVAPTFASGAEIVRFRLADWKAQHFHDQAQAKTFVDTVSHLGCEAKTGSHGDHIDVNYRCVQWRSLQAASHDSAHAWENWLRQAGFETQHQH
jgi:hypothetical protein